MVCFHYKINPNPRKNICCGKKWPNATFNLIFLGLGWPWVGEFVGSIISVESEYVVHMKRRAAAIGGSTSWPTIAFLLFLPSGAGSTEELARISHYIVWFHPIICYKSDIGFGVVFQPNRIWNIANTLKIRSR